ncbi:MAG: glycosyltransferase family 4 protein [Gemmatimonadaceae bacterium]|nr:glycosyltransferase family 4 protein [Gloeobacterales cyanobacterium ES-bin-141]
MWEQVILPASLNGLPLFNPCNLAPLSYNNNIVVLHDVIPLLYPQFYNRVFRTYYAWLVPRLARSATHVVTVSEFSGEQIMRLTGIPQSRVSVVYNGVSEKFDPGLRSLLSPVWAKFGLAQPYVFYAGSLEPRKNVETLLKAFVFARQQMGLKCYSLVLAGSTHRNFSSVNLSGLIEQARQQTGTDIRLLGYVGDNDLAQLYANASLFVYPSICEGFGLPVLEAMASGTPVLAADSSSLREIIQVEELLHPVYDYRALAEKMTELLRNEYLQRRYSEAGLKHIRQFSWDRTAQKTGKILRMFT